MDFVIQTYNLGKVFKEKYVLKNINLNIEKGKIYGFLGENGAGKTTIFKLLCGLIRATEGEIKVLGMNINEQREKILENMGIIIENPVFYEELTARENLEIHLELMDRIELKNSISNTLKMVGLEKALKVKVGKFSLGMKQRLAIARAIIHKSKILILDEPINGLDPKGIRDIRKLIISIAEENDITILISSHILSELENLADKIIIISDGILVNELYMKDLKDKEESLEDYYFEKVLGDKYDE